MRWECGLDPTRSRLISPVNESGCGRGGPLTFHNDLDRERRRKADDDDSVALEACKKPRRKKAPGDVGDALRSVYQRTINEDIPPEMLDLLGKLG